MPAATRVERIVREKWTKSVVLPERILSTVVHGRHPLGSMEGSTLRTRPMPTITRGLLTDALDSGVPLFSPGPLQCPNLRSKHEPIRKVRPLFRKL